MPHALAAALEMSTLYQGTGVLVVEEQQGRNASWRAVLVGHTQPADRVVAAVAAIPSI
jgi:hypothetical protein